MSSDARRHPQATSGDPRVVFCHYSLSIATGCVEAPAAHSVSHSLSTRPPPCRCCAPQTHAACQVPLGSFAGSKLSKTMATFTTQYKQWDDGVGNVQRNRDLAVGEGRSFWEAWTAGPTEGLLHKAEDLQKLLEHATDEWKEVIIGVQHPEIGSASRKFEAKQGIKVGGGREEIARVCGAAAQEHVRRVHEDLSAFKQDLAARIAEAKQTLPVVTENAARVTSWLKDRSAKSLQGAHEWAAFMEKRRAAGAKAFAAQLVAEQEAADKALQAAVAAETAAGQMGFKAEFAAYTAFGQSVRRLCERTVVTSHVSPLGRRSPPLLLLNLSANFLSQLFSSSPAPQLDERKKSLSRRYQRVERESAEHAAVQRRAAEHSASDAQRAEAAAASAAKCVAFLSRMTAADLPQRGDAIVAAVSALCHSVAEVWTAKMVFFGEQIEMSKADLGMNYVILFNKADEDLGRLSEQIKAALREATERELNKTSVRKEAMNMVKGLGKEGGFLSGFGFGKKEARSAECGAISGHLPAAAAIEGTCVPREARDIGISPDISPCPLLGRSDAPLPAGRKGRCRRRRDARAHDATGPRVLVRAAPALCPSPYRALRLLQQ